MVKCACWQNMVLNIVWMPAREPALVPVNENMEIKFKVYIKTYT